MFSVFCFVKSSSCCASSAFGGAISMVPRPLKAAPKTTPAVRAENEINPSLSVMRMRSCTIVTPSTLAVFSESNEVCDTAVNAALASCALAFCALTPGGARHTKQKIAACSKAHSRYPRGTLIIGLSQEKLSNSIQVGSRRKSKVRESYLGVTAKLRLQNDQRDFRPAKKPHGQV